MSYMWSAHPGGYVLAPCLQQLAQEIATHPRYRNLTNLGELGDTSHWQEGSASDHVPFIIGPGNSAYPGTGYVRAIDLGGPGTLQAEMRNFIQAHYAHRDARMYPYGYVHMNNYVTTWFGTGLHYDPGDVGHLHISVTQRDGANPSPSGWVPALDSRAGWGLSTPQPTPPKPKLVVGMYEVIRNSDNGAVRAYGIGYWQVLDTATDVDLALGQPLCINTDKTKPRDVSPSGMAWLKAHIAQQ